MKNNYKGITLIALIITIIVMLLLVTVTITMTINGGLFGYAGNATKDTEIAKQEEQNLANVERGLSTDALIAKFAGDGGETETPEYSQNLLDNNKVLIQNAKVTQENQGTHEEQTAIIPKGFGIVVGCETIKDGLVISDKFDNNGNSIGNEFVWIPVTLSGTTTEEKEDSFDSIRTTKNNSNFSEPASGEEKEYNDMRTSVINNNGFYIARYEAGYATGRVNGSTSVSTIPLSKKGVYPYTFVNWTDAKSASKSMYNDSTKYGVTSTLCYGVQWDAMLSFLGKTSETDCTSWGNYCNAGPFNFTGEYYIFNNNVWKNDLTSKTEDTSMLLQTGATNRNRLKNIYDVAGNVYEWTMEKVISTSARLRRGGNCGDDGDEDPAKNRSGYDPTNIYGFSRISYNTVLVVLLFLKIVFNKLLKNEIEFS